MKIFLSLSPSGNSSVPNSETWLNNIYEPLLDLGNDVFLLRIDKAEKIIGSKRGTRLFKGKFSDYLLNTFKKEHAKNKIDLFFSYFLDDYIYPEVIDEIKKIGIPTANFSCNNTHQFYLTENIAPHYDFNLHSEKNAAADFKRIGANPVWFQMAANPKYYFPIKSEYKYDVSFLGSSYAKRANYILYLLSNKIDVHCFGPNWLINKPFNNIKWLQKEYKRIEKIVKSLIKISREQRYNLSSDINSYDLQCLLRSKYPNNMHYPIPDKEIVKLFGQSRINLGFLEVFAQDNVAGGTTKQHLHLREFEVPMAGGLYITNYSDELAEHYEPDKEVLVFHNKYELIDKINYYIKNPNLAEKIRRAGHIRALECHTFQKRFQTVFESMKLF